MEEVKKLKKRDGWTKILESKARLIQKHYGIITLEISKTKIDFEKIETTEEKLVTQNAIICIRMKIESLF